MILLFSVVRLTTISVQSDHDFASQSVAYNLQSLVGLGMDFGLGGGGGGGGSSYNSFYASALISCCMSCNNMEPFEN